MSLEPVASNQEVAASRILARWWRRARVQLLVDAFPDEFLEHLLARIDLLPSSKASKNMYATRYFLTDEDLAAQIFSFIPHSTRRKLKLSGCCSDLRFIHYPLGGFIAPHTDGVRVDSGTGRETRVSFLLYLATVPEGEGGETTFLDRLPEHSDNEPRPLQRLRPVRGCMALFPHSAPHQGEAVGAYPKVLLRGDLF